MNIYDTVTERIIEQLQAGIIPWRKEWKSSQGSRIPMNYATKRPYRGVNVLTLLCSHYDDQRWMTYKQAKDAGYQVRKGEKSSPVIFWKFDQKTNAATGEDYKIAFARAYNVFNIEQIDGIPNQLPFDAFPFDPIAEAEKIADGYMTRANHPTLAHGGSRAFYRSSTDHVQMPEKERFSASSAYYATLFHEFAHSTGHAKRLDRKDSSGNEFGDKEYSKEELLAEFAASFVCAEAGCANDSIIANSAAYIQSWLRQLKNDNTLAVMAAQRAQKAADCILGRSMAAAVTEEVAA